MSTPPATPTKDIRVYCNLLRAQRASSAARADTSVAECKKETPKVEDFPSFPSHGCCAESDDSACAGESAEELATTVATVAGAAGSAKKRKWISDMRVARKRSRHEFKNYLNLYQAGPVAAENDRRLDAVHNELVSRHTSSMAEYYYNLEVLGRDESVCRRLLREDLQRHLASVDYAVAYMGIAADSDLE